MQMLDVHLPTTDGRDVILTRYTQPERELQVVAGPIEIETTGTTAADGSPLANLPTEAL